MQRVFPEFGRACSYGDTEERVRSEVVAGIVGIAVNGECVVEPVPYELGSRIKGDRVASPEVPSTAPDMSTVLRKG